MKLINTSRATNEQHGALGKRDRAHVAVLAHLHLWPITEIAKAYNTTPRTVRRAAAVWTVV